MLHFLSTEYIWRDLAIVTILVSTAFVALTIRDFLERNVEKSKDNCCECKSQELCNSFTTNIKTFTEENNCEINRKMIAIERNRLFDRNEIEQLKEKLAEFKFP
ncbi:hypothetical protein ABK040_016061 [Willaertia magna]